MVPTIRYGRRSFPLASVGETFTPGATGRQTEAGKDQDVGPASARPFTWCQAVVQIRSAPSLSGKLYKTRTRSFVLLTIPVFPDGRNHNSADNRAMCHASSLDSPELTPVGVNAKSTSTGASALRSVDCLASKAATEMQANKGNTLIIN